MSEKTSSSETILLAGATGAIGRLLLPMLVDQGHTVVGTTRQPEKQKLIRSLGGRPEIVDFLDRPAVLALIERLRPSVIVDQLTDLSARQYAANSRLRIDGTRNLVDGAKAVGVRRIVAESISFVYAPTSHAATEEDPLEDEPTGSVDSTVAGVKALENAVAELPEGVVLRYGILYGPGTWNSAEGETAQSLLNGTYEARNEITSFIHVEDAARAAVEAINWRPGIYNIVDDDPAPVSAWLPLLAEALGAPAPKLPSEGELANRAASNFKARKTGWAPLHPTWRTGFFTALG